MLGGAVRFPNSTRHREVSRQSRGDLRRRWPFPGFAPAATFSSFGTGGPLGRPAGGAVRKGLAHRRQKDEEAFSSFRVGFLC